MTDTLVKTRVFQNGNSQAIRIPQNMRTDQKEYYIRKVGDTYIAFPAADPWATVKEVIGTFPSDFLNDRELPPLQDIPEREAL